MEDKFEQLMQSAHSVGYLTDIKSLADFKTKVSDEQELFNLFQKLNESRSLKEDKNTWDTFKKWLSTDTTVEIPTEKLPASEVIKRFNVDKWAKEAPEFMARNQIEDYYSKAENENIMSGLPNATINANAAKLVNARQEALQKFDRSQNVLKILEGKTPVQHADAEAEKEANKAFWQQEHIEHKDFAGNVSYPDIYNPIEDEFTGEPLYEQTKKPVSMFTSTDSDGQVKVHDTYNPSVEVTKKDGSKQKTGLWDWLLPQKENIIEGSKVRKDTDYESVNRMFGFGGGEGSLALAKILQANLPGYEITMGNTDRGYSAKDKGGITITAPNGEELEIQGGIKDSYLDNQATIDKLNLDKYNLIDFVNRTAPDGFLHRVSKMKSAIFQHQENILETPYNRENPKEGGIGLNESDIRILDKYMYAVPEVDEETGEQTIIMTPNPTLFTGARQRYADQLYEQGMISEEARANPYTIGADQIEKIIKDGLSHISGKPSFTDPYQPADYDESGNYDPTLGQKITDQRTLGAQGSQTPYTDMGKDPYGTKQRKLDKPWITPLAGDALKDTDAENPIPVYDNELGEHTFAGPGSKEWKNTEENLIKAYGNNWNKLSEAKQEEVIKYQIASTLYEKNKDAAVKSHLSQYLRSVPEYQQALANYYSIEKKDLKFNEALGLQLNNEVQIKNLTNNTDVLYINWFESVYKNPNESFPYAQRITLGGTGETLKLPNGEVVGLDTYEKYLNAVKAQGTRLDLVKDTQAQYNQLLDDVGDLEANLDLLAKDYDWFSSSMTSLGLTFSDIGMGIGYYANKGLTYGLRGFNWLGEQGTHTGEYLSGNKAPVSHLMHDRIDDKLKEWDAHSTYAYGEYDDWKREVKEGYADAISFRQDMWGGGGAFSSASNFGQFMAEEVGKQIPIIATMVVTGGAAAPWVIGAYAAGQHWAEADTEELRSGKMQSEWQQALAATGYGAAEGVFEALTTIPMLRRGADIFSKLGKRELTRDAFKAYVKQGMPRLLTDPLSEASAEFMTQVSQNWIDGRPLLEGADHAAFVGGMFGFAMSSGPFMAGAIARKFTDYNAFQPFRERSVRIQSMTQQLNYLRKNNLISERAIKARENLINNLKSENKTFLETQFKGIRNNLGAPAFNQLNDAFESQERTRASVEELLDNATDTQSEDVQNQLKEFKKQFDAEQFAIDNFRNNKQFRNNFKLLKVNDRARYDRILQEAKAKLLEENNGDQIRDDQIGPTAEAIYTAEMVDENYEKVSKNNTKGNKIVKYDQNNGGLLEIETEINKKIEQIKEEEGLSEKERWKKIQKYKDGFKQLKDGITNGTVSGVNLHFGEDGLINLEGKVKQTWSVGFKENAVKNGKTNIFNHEYGHAAFGQLLGFESGAFAPLAQEVASFLQVKHKDIWHKILLKHGSEVIKKPDELIMNFLEYVGKGDINAKNMGLMGTTFGFLYNKVLGKERKERQIDFAGETDAINFVIGLGKAMKDGSLTQAQLEQAKKSKVISDAKTKWDTAKSEALKNKAIAEYLIQNKVGKLQLSKGSNVEEATKVLEEIIELNKSKPKGWKTKAKGLAKELRRIKGTFLTYKPKETNTERKERVNELEERFRGNLEGKRKINDGVYVDPIEEVFKGYEEKILAIARGKNYFQTAAYQNQKWSTKEKEQELLQATRITLRQHIKNFDPTINKDFDAYIMSYLDRKVMDAHKNITKEYGDKFTVGLEEAAEVTGDAGSGGAFAATTQAIEKTLRQVFNIQKGSQFYNASVAAVKNVMKKGLPKFEYTQRKKKGEGKTVTLEEVKNILANNPTGETLRQAERDLAGIYSAVKSKLENQYSEELYKEFKKEFLNAKELDSFLEKNQPELMERIPISDLVALERLVSTDEKILTEKVVMDPKTGRTVLNPTEVKQHEGSGNLQTATTTQGPTLYKRLNPTSKEFGDFFKVRGRNNALAKVLSKYLGLDATMQTLNSEKIINEIAKDNPLIREQLAENFLKSYAEAIGRGVEFQYAREATSRMDANLRNEFKSLQEPFVDIMKIMDPTLPGVVDIAVDSVFEGKKWKAHRGNIKKAYNQLLKPYIKAVSQPGDIQIDLLDYIKSAEAATLSHAESISKFWNAGSMAQAFSNSIDVQNQKKFINMLAQRSRTQHKGNDVAAAKDWLYFQNMFQNGTKVETSSARGMLYGSVSQMKLEFFMPNFGFQDYKTEGRGKDRTLQFQKVNGDWTTAVPFPVAPSQSVSQDMIDNTMSAEDIQYREDFAKKAWDFSKTIYENAHRFYKLGAVTNLNMAMLMTGMGQFMQGPIRHAAPFRYAPDNIGDAAIMSRVVEGIHLHPLTEARKGKGTFKDGVFTTRDAALARRIVENIDMRFTDSYVDGVSTIDFTRDASRTTKNRVSNPWKEASDYGRKNLTKIIKEQTSKNYEYEHGIPAKLINLMMVDAIFNPKSKVDLKKLQESYAVGAIPVDMNANISNLFGESMPFDYKIGDISPKRWFNKYTSGGASYAMRDIRNDKVYGQKEAALWRESEEAYLVNKEILNNNVTGTAELQLSAEQLIEYAQVLDAALNIARDPNAPVKKARVFDFDDTLARTKSKVKYTMPDTSTGELTAEEFAKEGTNLEDLGAKFDFSDFNKVVDGQPGPLSKVAQTIANKRGTKDLFVLTARSMEAAPAIKQFLDKLGIKIPLKNIIGLGNSSPYAKSKWVVEKAAEGYNDFYFADDHTANVKAVKEALDVLDVKSKVQQAKFQFSQEVDTEFNKIIEHSSGVEWYKEISKAKAEIKGRQNQKRKIHPYSAEDFEGLIYPLLGKGKKGDAAYKWFDDHLFKPFARAMSDLSTARVNLMDDFRMLKKTLDVPKTLRKENSSGFTNENSVRAYVWTAMGYDIPGLSKTDLKEMTDIVANDPTLKLFAEELIKINKGEYIKPGESWLAGTITTDLIDGLNKIKRKEYLSEWKENVDLIFSEKNLNKLEAIFGAKYVEALKNSLGRMESGSNRILGQNRLANQVLDYLNNAQGVVMFLNMRSALLQGISSVNFLNWGFNNPAKAGVAFGNQPQYWKDFMELMNSDYLKDRRGGLAMNINENEVANAAKTATNKAKAVVSYIIQQGYAPTKFMDSFAIASGGATFFRNRINDLMKKNPEMSEDQARDIAYEEFVEIAEKNQQSARPDKISSQQASDLGRIMLNWANTQMQYVRIQKKAIQDITNGRGDFKSNISKIVYYGVIQNLWFQAAHSAVFALAFGDDDDDPSFKEDKILRTANGAADNILRGLGIGGHTFSVLKNWGMKIYKESQKEGRQDYVNTLWELIKLSPVISSKVSRLKGAAWEFNSKKRRKAMLDKGFSIDNPAYDATAKVISAVTNVPVDRVLLKFDNIQDALSEETETWMDIALLLGWPKWTLDAPKKESEFSGPSFVSPTFSESEFAEPTFK